MDEPDAEKIPPSLKTAVRRARVEQAERSDVVNDLRRAEMARLDILFDAFKPILAQIPANVDLFDCGIAPGERPRLFVDMIAFVEMAHDKRTYRFVQETRNGRVVIAESDKLDPIVEALTDYVARRLVEREAALAADLTSRYSLQQAGADARAQQANAAAARALGQGGVQGSVQASAQAARKPKARWRQRAESAFLFTIELLGAIVLFVLLIGALYLAWRFGESWWVSNYAQLR